MSPGYVEARRAVTTARAPDVELHQAGSEGCASSLQAVGTKRIVVRSCCLCGNTVSTQRPQLVCSQREREDTLKPTQTLQTHVGEADSDVFLCSAPVFNA